MVKKPLDLRVSSKYRERTIGQVEFEALFLTRDPGRSQVSNLRRLTLAVSTTAALACATGFGIGSAANAVPIINLGQTSGSNDVTATAAGGVTTIKINDALADITQILGGSPVDNVFVDLTATSIDAATGIGPAVLQHYSGTFCVSSLGGCTGIDYLSGSFTDAALGVGGQLSVTVGDPPDPLTLTSSVIPTDSLAAPNSLGFTFTDVTPAIHIAGGTVAAFTASFVGNAAASSVPEPSTWAMLALGFAGLGLLGYRKAHMRISTAA